MTRSMLLHCRPLPSLLAALPPDSPLYSVFALDAPPELGGVEQLVGRLELQGRLVTSNWADTRLFFRHQVSKTL